MERAKAKCKVWAQFKRWRNRQKTEQVHAARHASTGIHPNSHCTLTTFCPCWLVVSVERAVRQLPTRSLHATSRLLDRPAAYTIHQSLPPAPSAKLSLCTAVTTSDDTATTLHFSWPSLLSQVCSFLQREPTAEQLSVDECGAIGAFVSDEIGLHAVELSSEHIADFQHHMDDLLQYMLTKSAADVAVQRIIRFLRGQIQASSQHLQLYAVRSADVCAVRVPAVVC